MERRQRARRGEGRNQNKPQNGFAISEFRTLRRWSVTALANEIGISQPALSNIEAERRPASEEVLEAIADVLNIDVRAIKRTKDEAATKRSTGELAEAVA
jgi:transcriptional regulator with XRE-family HTH domain